MNLLENQAGSGQPFTDEASQAMLKTIADELNTSLGPVRDMLAGLAADQPLASAFCAHQTLLNLSESYTRLSSSTRRGWVPRALRDVPEPIRAERFLAHVHETFGEILELDSFRPEPNLKPKDRAIQAQPLVGAPESERVIWAAHGAVARASSRLSADMDWLHDHRDDLGYPMPSRLEAGEAVLKGVVDGLNASVGPIQAEWAGLAQRYRGTPVELGYHRFRHIFRITADPFTSSTLDILESRVREARDCLEGSVYYLRRVPDGPKPEERALRASLVDNPARAIWTARDAVDRAVSRVRGSVDVLNLSGLGEAERLVVGRSVLKGVMDELHASVGPPVLAVWGVLAGKDPNPSASDPASGKLGIALYMFHEASTQADGPFTQYTTGQVGELLAGAKSYLEGSVYYTRREPDEADSENKKPIEPIGSIGPIGSAPPTDWEGVVVTAVVTAAVVPFLKTLMTKAAEDTYAAARALLKKLFRHGRTAEHGSASQPKVLIVQDSSPDLDLALHLGVDTQDEALRRLADLDLDTVAGEAKSRKVKKLTIRWDEATQSWKTHEH